jgi:Domain of unknown function (DUF4956)
MTLLQQLVANSPIFQWFDKVSLMFVSRFLVDIFAVFILVRFIYFKHYRRTDLFLTFFGFNIIIFLITYLLNKVEMSMGAAFGLFAVFSMLRYRTENISAKDMTYLFIVIALGLITAISKGNWDELAVMSLILLALTALLESGLLMKKELTKNIVYDKISLITPEKREALIQDLKDRTGLNIHRVNINEIDFLKDATQITIFYHENQPK